MSTEDTAPDGTPPTASETQINPLKLAIAARLAELRMNPFAAATAAGLGKGFVNDILNGRKRSVKGDNLGRLANALGLSVEALLERSQIVNPPLPGSAARPFASPIDVGRLRVLVRVAFEVRGLDAKAAHTLTEALIALARPGDTPRGADLDVAELEALARTLARGLG